jgi:hypothetical protein
MAAPGAGNRGLTIDIYVGAGTEQCSPVESE